MSKNLKKRQNKDASRRGVRRRNSGSKGEGAAGGGGRRQAGKAAGGSHVGWSDFHAEVGRLFCRQRGAPDGF